MVLIDDGTTGAPSPFHDDDEKNGIYDFAFLRSTTLRSPWSGKRATAQPRRVRTSSEIGNWPS